MTRYQNASEALPSLLSHVLRGHETDSRNGKTKERLMQQITLENPDSPAVVTPGRKASLPAQIAETMWLLAGRNDIGWLSYYLPRAAEFSDDGKTWRGGYGPRIRDWRHDADPHGIDQLAHVVQLLQDDPATRRAVITIYDPATDTSPGKDIPCNNWVHFIARNGMLHAHVATRSNDLMWGWSGINSFEWTALLNVVASLTGLKRGSVTFSISSLHLYERHWAKARKIIAEDEGVASRLFFASDPKPILSSVESMDDVIGAWFEIEKMIREDHPNTMNKISMFPEPMMQSWLYALYAWHKDDLSGRCFPEDLQNTALYAALEASPRRKKPQAPAPLDVQYDFTDFANKLHREKHAAYGDSWKKRGEMLGIMANLARKVDRLGVEGGGDTSADTAIDFLMYLLKYQTWLHQQDAQSAVDCTTGEPHLRVIGKQLVQLKHYWLREPVENLIQQLKSDFDTLEALVTEKSDTRVQQVRRMILPAYVLAVTLWDKEQKANEVVKFGDGTPTSHAERNAARSWNPEAGQ